MLDGTRPIQITASAPGCSTVSAAIIVNDIERADLSVAITNSANEGDGIIQGTVAMTGTPAENISVTLISSDPALVSVPATVIIPVGQTNVTFNALVENPNRINGSELVTITAHVQNWTNGNAVINVQFPQASNLSLALPAQARESNGLLTNAGLVTLPGILSTNLVVSLLSSNTAKLLVPSTVTVLAGRISAAFNLTTVSGNPPESPVSVGVLATAPGFIPASASSSTSIDNQTPPAPCHGPLPPNFLRQQSGQRGRSPGARAWEKVLGDAPFFKIGGFESGDFSGWNASTNVVIDNGTVSPPSGDGLTPPFDGNFSALAEPVPPATSLLYQDTFHFRLMPPRSRTELG